MSAAPGGIIGRIRELGTRLSGSLHRRSIDQDLDDELQFHIDKLTEKNMRRGMSEEEARRSAQQLFGDGTRTREAARDELVSRGLEHFVQDVRYGLRMLRKAPAFTTVAVLSLALGIGANTAVFTIVNAVVLQPLPFPSPERLVSIGVKNDAAANTTAFSIADFRAVREQSHSFSAIGAFGAVPGGVTLTGADGAEQINATVVTSGLFDALGVRPMIGRNALANEESSDAPAVVLLSYRLWRDRFGASRDVIGQSLMLDGVSTRIIGVMPSGFALPNLPDDQMWPVLQFNTPRVRAPFWLGVYGRLGNGSTIQRANAELSSVAASVKTQFPNSPPHWSYKVDDLKTTLVGNAHDTVLILYGAVALILLMASANVANLSLARATARLPEFALRSALGAGRRRIVRQLVTEGLLIALLGGTLGLFVAYAGTDFLARAMPINMPHLREIRIDGWVLGFTAAIALCVGVAIGLAPAFNLRHERLADELQDGLRSTSQGRAQRRLAHALVVSEFALALTVLVGAGLAVNSLWRLQHVDIGAQQHGVLVVRLGISQAAYPQPAQVDAFFENVMQRVRQLPGVSDAAVSMAVPPHRLEMHNPFTPEGKTYANGESPPVAEEILVSPRYFDALGIRLLQGRAFTDADRENAPGVVIVNETFARQSFPDGNVVGRWIQTGEPNPASPKLTIVGVVPDVKYSGMEAGAEPTIYVPHKQALWWRTMYLVVKTSGDPLAQVNGVRAAVKAVDPQVALQEVHTLEGLVGESVSKPRYLATLLGAFGVLGLVLAGAGIYGVLSYTVNRRTRETGVRLALGASPAGVMRLVIRDGMRVALIGTAIGLVLAFVTTRVLASLLYQVSPLDPLTFALTAVFLLVIGFFACAIPARRASRTDPLSSIRVG